MPHTYAGHLLTREATRADLDSLLELDRRTHAHGTHIGRRAMRDTLAAATADPDHNHVILFCSPSGEPLGWTRHRTTDKALYALRWTFPAAARATEAHLLALDLLASLAAQTRRPFFFWQLSPPAWSLSDECLEDWGFCRCIYHPAPGREPPPAQLWAHKIANLTFTEAP